MDNGLVNGQCELKDAGSQKASLAMEPRQQRTDLMHLLLQTPPLMATLLWTCRLLQYSVNSRWHSHGATGGATLRGQRTPQWAVRVERRRQPESFVGCGADTAEDLLLPLYCRRVRCTIPSTDVVSLEEQRYVDNGLLNGQCELKYAGSQKASLAVKPTEQRTSCCHLSVDVFAAILRQRSWCHWRGNVTRTTDSSMGSAR